MLPGPTGGSVHYAYLLRKEHERAGQLRIIHLPVMTWQGVSSRLGCHVFSCNPWNIFMGWQAGRGRSRVLCQAMTLASDSDHEQIRARRIGSRKPYCKCLAELSEDCVFSA